MDSSPEIAWSEAFERDGFVNVGSVLDPHEVRELQLELEHFVEAAFRGAPPERPSPWIARDIAYVPGRSVYQLVNLFEVSPVYRRLVRDPRIARIAAGLAKSKDLQVWQDQVQYKPAGTGGSMTWHQDFLYWGPIEPAIMITAWIALDDATIENGCMWMVPGSHRWGSAYDALLRLQGLHEADSFGELPVYTPPPGTGPWQKPRSCPVRAGEVHFHHCLTWHGSPHNRATSPRRAYAIHYMPSGVRFSGQAEHPLAARIRIPKGVPMLADGEPFPIVWRDGRPELERER